MSSQDRETDPGADPVTDYDSLALRKLLRESVNLAGRAVTAPFRPLALPLPGKRLIFTATNGRSGSDMLHRLFEALPDLTTTHEPKPDFRHFRPYVIRRPWLARAWLRNIKLPAIARLPGSVYVETSHMFCKGYLEPMLSLGQDFDLILLERPAREIALSMSKLPAIPGTTRWSRSFYLSPDEPSFLPVDRTGLSDYQVCFWHALENERRQQHYGALMRERGRRVVTIRTGELSSREAAVRMFAELGFDAAQVDESRLAAIQGQRANLKAHEKKERAVSPAELDAEEAEVRERARPADWPRPPA